jgi:hypothetical protein
MKQNKKQEEKKNNNKMIQSVCQTLTYEPTYYS